MHKLSLHLRAALIAIVAVVMSAGLAFAAPPEAAWEGLANAASHAGKTVPVAGGDVETTEDEDTDAEDEATEEGVEGEESEEGTEEAGDNCLVDPTLLTEEELALMKHGSIACWAAHQETWPEEFKNHGAWVSSWAHAGKGGDDLEGEDELAAPKLNGNGNGKGKGKGKGHQE